MLDQKNSRGGKRRVSAVLPGRRESEEDTSTKMSERYVNLIGKDVAAAHRKYSPVSRLERNGRAYSTYRQNMITRRNQSRYPG
jgi:hypothetical protein